MAFFRFQPKKDLIIITSVLLTLITVLILHQIPNKSLYSGPVESLRLCSTKKEAVSAPIFIAQSLQLFTKYGLDVTVSHEDAGVFCLQNLIDQKTDLATAASVGYMFKSFDQPDIKIISILATSSENIQMVSKKSIVSDVKNLKNKKIGTTVKTDAHYFLNTLLTFAYINPSDVQIISFGPQELPQALKTGTVDAIITWEPHITNAKNLIGDDATILPGQGGEKWYWVLTGSSQVIENKPAAVKRFVQAINEAELYIHSRPDESIGIVAKSLGLSEQDAQVSMSKYDFSLHLAQDLLISLEYQTRWAIEQHFTDKTEVPNYLTQIYFDPLEEIAPETMTIIH